MPHKAVECGIVQVCEPAERTICYAWVASRCRRLFDATFHHSVLETLVKQGHLEKADSSRGGRVTRLYDAVGNLTYLKDAVNNVTTP